MLSPKIRELRDEQGLLQRQQAVVLEINTPMHYCPVKVDE